MSKLFFMNESSFDIRAVFTRGISVKEIDNPIGQFGTGFGYAVSVILRLGGSISLLTDGKYYEFVKRTENIRGKDFDCIYVLHEGEQQAMGVTTHYGVNWKPWMAFRELYSNCLDENGSVATDYPGDTNTVVSVDCPEIYEAHKNKHLYFIEGSPLYKTSEIEMYDKPGQFLFYRGIAVYALDKPSLYTYNILSKQTLTEDRTLSNFYYASIDINKVIQNDVSGRHLRKILTANNETLEGTIDYNSTWGTSVELLEMVQEIMVSGVGVRESIRKFVEHFDQVRGNFPEIAISKVQQKQLDKAISLLSKMDVPVKQFPIKIVEGLGNGVMGRAHEGTIFLSKIPFDMGTKQLASTLLEEWVHNKYGHNDFDRGMQNYLFDKIVSLGEELVGEPV